MKFPLLIRFHFFSYQRLLFELAFTYHQHVLLVAYHQNPLMCSIYSQYLLTVCDKANACAMISDAGQLQSLKDSAAKDLIVCCIFDLNSWPIVDMAFKDKTPVVYIQQPESPKSIFEALKSVSMEGVLCWQAV